MNAKNDPGEWDLYYKSHDVKTMPWYLEELDADLAQELKDRNITSGTFLDLCTGPGTQAAELARCGLNVTGTDISPAAIEKAKDLSSDVEFIQDDILKPRLEKQFDYIFDRGCFHVFPPSKRKIYVRNIKKRLNPNGILFLKCFSSDEPESGHGPYRISKQEIKDAFNKDFHIEKIKDTFFKGKTDHAPRALFVVMRKK
ncbi:MAG: class I SAM-dependent methyltransferase [Actinobacteria bacterium]|nr:class I SAM-dependent methyltransferase [Actinomycetota bacterium]